MNDSISNSLKERLSIELTTCCNSSCLHCFNQSRAIESSELSFEVVKGIVREGIQAGYRGLHLTGGEPLLWSGLFELLKDAFKAGYQTISLNTNGTLVTPKVAKKLAEYDGLIISISLEGPEAHHNRLRGEGSYEKARSAIDDLLKQDIELSIFTIARKNLVKELPHFVNNLYQDFPGINHLTLIQLINVTSDYFFLSNELLDAEDFLKMVKTVALLNLYGLKTLIKNNPLANLVAKMLGIPWIPQAHPLYDYGSIFIMANGDIRLSHSSGDILGQYAPGMILKVLNSDRYRSTLAASQYFCHLCKYMNLCKNFGIPGPLEHFIDQNSTITFCRKVLDKVHQEPVTNSSL